MTLATTDPATSRRVETSTPCRVRWTFVHAAAAVLLVAAAVFATFDAWSDIVHIGATNDESSHVFLVPFVAGWLIWVRRERLRDCVQRAVWVGPAVIALGWALNSIGVRHLIQSFWHFGA